MTNTLGYIYCGSRGTSLYLGSTRTALKTLVILVASPRSFFSNFVLTCMLHLRFAMIPSLLSGLTTKIKRTQQQPRNKINENIIFSEKSLTGFSLENYPAENMCLDFFFLFFLFFLQWIVLHLYWLCMKELARTERSFYFLQIHILPGC